MQLSVFEQHGTRVEFSRHHFVSLAVRVRHHEPHELAAGATNSIGGVTGAFLQCWRQQAWPRICSASSDVVVQQMEIDRTTIIKLPLMIFLTSAMLGQCARLAVTVRIRSCGGFYAPTALNAIGITTKSCTASKTPCAITPGIRFFVR